MGVCVCVCVCVCVVCVVPACAQAWHKLGTLVPAAARLVGCSALPTPPSL